MQFSLTLLGSGSATPQPHRFHSAQALQVQERLYLIDCGEGAQIRMSEFGVKRSRIHQIFISHLHGDHFFGLSGLLTSYGLNGRQQPLDIFSPPGLETVMRALMLPHGQNDFSFPIHFHALDTETHQLIFEDNTVQVYGIPLRHSVPTVGFLFVEKERPRNILPEKIEQYQIPYTQIPAIKAGADLVLPNGEVIPNETLTSAPPLPRRYAYCSDTLYTPAIVPLIRHVDLLYHEATFLHEDQAYALETTHSTALEAAMIAREAQVGQLVIGHYSSRYKDVSVLLTQARTVFPNTIGGEDGLTIDVPLQQR